MGCICSKWSRTGDDTTTDSPTQRGCSFKASASTLRLRNPSKLEELVAAPPESQSVKSKVIVQPPDNVLVIPIPSTVDRKFERAESQLVRHSERHPTQQNYQRNSTVGVNESQGVWVGRVPKQIEAEQVAAGWPSWLASVAGEAIKGWVPRRADSFEKLDKIGQGTYSHVYRARDLETGKIVALKKVRFVNMDPESVRFMAREILILRRLDHPNILKLEGLVTSRMSCGLYLVFEYMEHDLAGLAATPGLKFTEPQVKCYMQQLLSGLEHCHNRGVLHRDIKGSNILIDNNGNLQIADFGLATLFNPEQSQPLTSRVVTLWYRPPELLLGATNYGVAVDLWSAGCILAELLAGKPIMPGRTEVEQLHKIFKLCGSPSEDYWRKWKLPHATLFKPQHPYKRCLAETFKDFPASALSLLDRLLAVEPTERGTAADALKSEFFTTQPLACDPSSIPKYPPSKEFDAKLRNEARRQRTTGEKTQEPSNRDRVPKETGRRQIREGNGDLQSFQSHGDQPNPKSCGGNYITPMDDVDSGFSAGPSKARSRGAAWNSFSHLGLLNHPGVFGPICNGKQKEDENQTVRDQAYIGSSKGAKASNCAELRTQRSCMPQMEVSHKGVQHQRQKQILNKYSPMEVVDSPETTQWTHHLVDRPTTTTHRKDERAKEAATTYGQKKNRLHYSGPLLPPSANLDEMLKEHERQIQAAVRKARLNKVKSKKN